MSAKNMLSFMLIAICISCLLKSTMQKPILSEGKNLNNDQMKLRTVKRSEIIDQMNTCIDACSECLSEDLENEEDSENSAVLVCANECVVHNSPRKVMMQLLRRPVFGKEFATCFMNLTFKN